MWQVRNSKLSWKDSQPHTMLPEDSKVGNSVDSVLFHRVLDTAKASYPQSSHKAHSV